MALGGGEGEEVSFGKRFIYTKKYEEYDLKTRYV